MGRLYQLKVVLVLMAESLPLVELPLSHHKQLVVRVDDRMHVFFKRLWDRLLGLQWWAFVHLLLLVLERRNRRKLRLLINHGLLVFEWPCHHHLLRLIGGLCIIIVGHLWCDRLLKDRRLIRERMLLITWWHDGLWNFLVDRLSHQLLWRKWRLLLHWLSHLGIDGCILTW